MALLVVFPSLGCRRASLEGAAPGPRASPTSVGAVVPPTAAPVAPVASAAPSLGSRLPYIYQYDNRNEPGNTCGLTSAAMVLAGYGESVTPDALYDRFGKSRAQEPAGVVGLLRQFGLRADGTKTGNRAALRAHLSKGLVAVVHGNWTGSGHIVVFRGVSDAGWLVNDPAGDWTRCPGYTCSSRGENVTHAFGGPFDARLSHDGDVWYTLVHGR